MPKTANRNIIMGISGASGAIYARRLLDMLEAVGCWVHLIITAPAERVISDELAVDSTEPDAILGRKTDNIITYDNDNMFGRPASGSFLADAMVVCPCSSHSIAAIAAGLADTLLLRAAYVSLKQRRRLILVHRETPLSDIDLENMLRITRAGGIVCPANPAFYMAPETIDQLVDSVVGRLLDLLDIEHDLPVRWQS